MSEVDQAARKVSEVTDSLAGHATKSVESLLSQMNAFVSDLSKIA